MSDILSEADNVTDILLESQNHIKPSLFDYLWSANDILIEHLEQDEYDKARVLITDTATTLYDNVINPLHPVACSVDELLNIPRPVSYYGRSKFAPTMAVEVFSEHLSLYLVDECHKDGLMALEDIMGAYSRIFDAISSE